MPDLNPRTNLKPFAAGLAATLSLVGGAVIAGRVAGDRFGAAPYSTPTDSDRPPAISIPRPRPGIDRPPAVIRTFAQPTTGVGVTVSSRPGGRRTTRTSGNGGSSTTISLPVSTSPSPSSSTPRSTPPPPQTAAAPAPRGRPPPRRPPPRRAGPRGRPRARRRRGRARRPPRRRRSTAAAL